MYLQVLEDIWNRVYLFKQWYYISFDLSETQGCLTEGEKQAIAWLFGYNHNVVALMMSYKELAGQGYFTKRVSGEKSVLYQWERGVLFKIIFGNGRKESSIFCQHWNLMQRNGAAPRNIFFGGLLCGMDWDRNQGELRDRLWGYFLNGRQYLRGGHKE